MFTTTAEKQLHILPIYTFSKPTIDYLKGEITNCDIKDLTNSHLFKIALPGFEKDEISITTNRDILTIKAKKKYEYKTEHYLLKGMKSEHEHSYRLPYIATSVEAELENGILTLEVFKSDLNDTKTIEIK